MVGPWNGQKPKLTFKIFSVSAILMQMFGWMIADPVCSIFIAVLIALSVGSLVADSMAILMQRSPKELDHSLPEAYQKVMQLEGVQGVHETHFWTLCTNYYCGGEDPARPVLSLISILLRSEAGGVK